MTTERKRPPTLADVAELAGLSAQTVSNYLTGRNKPRGDNLQRLESAIQQLNYHPSAAARALRSKRSNIIAMLLEDERQQNGQVDSRLDNSNRGSSGQANSTQANSTQASSTQGWEPLHALFLYGATSKARELGFYITNVLTWHGDTENQASRLVREGLVDGLIFSTEVLTGERLKRLQKVAQNERVPIVLLQERQARPHLWNVAADDESGARMALTHLLELGHRHLALMLVEPLWPGPVRRAEAFIAAAREASVTVEKWVSPHYTVDAVRARVAPELTRKDRPTGIFAVNDITAMAVIQQATELGLSVPGDCSVVGFNDLDLASHFRPAITTIHMPAIGMGARAAEMLINASRGEKVEKSVVFPVDFVRRESTGPAPTLAPTAKRGRVAAK